ncbi:MAG TPA: MFS transporter [Thermoanaerobaculia bacterium]|jgi:MFS family permease|nr:MFS transporter [Thermoanaerobaculia bacterium]
MQSTTLKQLWVLMATVFIDMVGGLMVFPLLPFYAKRLGATDFTATLLVTTFFLAQATTSPMWGRLSDRYGRRPMILVGLLSSAAAYVLFGLASALWILFVSRLVQGAGGGTTGVVQAYVSDAVEPQDRAKALGWISAATSAGVMLGPLLGSFSTYLGPQAPGFLAAGLCVANALFAWRWLPETNRLRDAAPETDPAAPPVRRSSSWRATWSVISHPAAPISSLIWIYTIGMMAFMAMNAVLALFLGKQFGVTVQTIGYFYTYVGCISLVMRAVLLGPALKRFGEVGATRLGALSLVIGLATIPIADSLPALAITVLFVPIGTALLFPATTALLSRQAPRGETGLVMGIQQTFGNAARTVGPAWAGALFQKDLHYPFWVAAALMLGVSFLTRRQQTEPRVDKQVPAADPT